jgi:hypothetical protein
MTVEFADKLIEACFVDGTPFIRQGISGFGFSRLAGSLE